MRAWRVHEHGPYDEVLTLDECRDPTPANGEVVIDVAACGLNFPDLLLTAGTYQEKPPLPFSPGREVSGTVARGGHDAGFTEGQRVIAMAQFEQGGLRERTAVPAANVMPIPNSLDDITAAGLFLTYQTAHVALHRRAAIRAGETLLVHGAAGGVGSAAVQLGKAAGATVVASAGGAVKAAVCRELGADVVLDHHEEDFVEVVKDLTGGAGADVILDPVGGETYDRSGKAIAFEGRLLVIGFASGTIPRPPLGYPLVKNFSIVGVHWGLYRRNAPDVVREIHESLLALHEADQIAPRVYASVPFEDAVDGLRMLADREAIGKVVVDVTGHTNE